MSDDPARNRADDPALNLADDPAGHWATVSLTSTTEFAYPNTLKQQKNTDLKPLTPFKKAKLLEINTISRRRQEFHIRMLADAANLAVTQVQEKRIEMLEKGPSVTVTDVFIDLLLSLVVMPVVTMLAKKAIQTIINDVLKHRSMFKLLPKTKLGREMVLDIRLESLTEEDVDFEIKDLLKSTELKELYHENVFKVVDQVAPTVKELKKFTDVYAISYAEADSAGVSLLESIQSFKRKQLAAVSRYHDAMDTVIRCGHGTEAFWDKLHTKLRNLNENQWQISKREYDILKRQFEFFVWMGTYEIEVVLDPTTGWILKGLPTEFRDYFLRRIPSPRSAEGVSYWHEEKKKHPDKSDKVITSSAALGLSVDLRDIKISLDEINKHTNISAPQKQRK
jgi:hypothetical protein